MKKFVALLLFLIMITGCSLAKIDKDITIDMTKDFAPETVLKDIKEGTEISYIIDEENSKLIINLTNGDKEQKIEEYVTLLYPEYSISEEITADLVEGFNIEDYVVVEEGVNVSYVLDKENQKISITLSKGIWQKEITQDAKVNVPYYEVADEIEITKLFGLRIEDFVKAEDGVDIEYDFDKENMKLSVTLSKGMWSENFVRDVEYIELEYPVTFTSVEGGYFDEIKEMTNTKLVLVSPTYCYYESEADTSTPEGVTTKWEFNYNQDNQTMTAKTITNRFWFNRRVNCTNPSASVTHWTEGSRDYCTFVFPVNYPYRYEIDGDYFIYIQEESSFTYHVKFKLDK